MFYKRKFTLFTCVIMSLCLLFSGCDTGRSNNDTVDSEFSVSFINVLDGNSVLINLKDKASILIDCGQKSKFAKENIYSELDKVGVKTLDYLIISNPLPENLANACDIIQSYEVKNVYLPYVLTEELFVEYSLVLSLVKSLGIEIKTSKTYEFIKVGELSLAFLSPAPYGSSNSPYNDLNTSEIPTIEQMKNVSPIIYLSYKNTRFLFCGNALSSQEEYVINNYKVGLYEKFYSPLDVEINLSAVDFLVVGDHGSEYASSEEFVSLLTPSNAIISVSGNNKNKNPSAQTLYRFTSINPDINFYRTDVFGTIRIEVNEYGKYALVTDR